MHEVEVLKDLIFDPDNGLALDLYSPVNCVAPPVVVYLHGGGFQVGDKLDDRDRVRRLAEQGLVVAAVNYRLSPAVFPSPLSDVKRAVRWLRREADTLGIYGEAVGVWGASAGGYLATMIGLTGDDADFRELGDDTTDAVQAVVTWFAPSDLVANSRRSPLEELVASPPVEHTLLGRDGVQPDDADLVRANPIARTLSSCPPFLVATGDRDRIVPEVQSRYLHDALVRAGANSTLSIIGGAGHEDPKFDAPAHIAMTAAWLLSHLHRQQ